MKGIAALFDAGEMVARPARRVAAPRVSVIDDEVTGVLMSVAPIVGIARVASAAPELASALGYELDVPDQQ